MSVESSSTVEEQVKSSERFFLVLGRRTAILKEIFSNMISPLEGDSEETEIPLIKDKFGNGLGGDKWGCSIVNEEGVKYSFFLSENSSIKRVYLKSGGEREEEKVYIHELEIKIPYKRWEKEKILEELNLVVFLKRRFGAGKSIGFQSLEEGVEFPLEGLSELDNKEFREQFSSMSRIPSFKTLGLEYEQGDEVDTVTIEISF